MRISDWSSDVCSSDLGACVGLLAGRDRIFEIDQRDVGVARRGFGHFLFAVAGCEQPGAGAEHFGCLGHRGSLDRLVPFARCGVESSLRGGRRLTKQSSAPFDQAVSLDCFVAALLAMTSRSGRRSRGSRILVCESRQYDLGSSSRSEEHTSELQSRMRISSSVFCLKNTTQSKTKIIYNLAK